jgi:hypothetical protein
MTPIGSTMMYEQTGPRQLVRDVALAEEAAPASFTGNSAARTCHLRR